MDDLQEWKDKQNCYLIVLLVIFMFFGMFFGAIVGMINAASLDELLGNVLLGALCGAAFVVSVYFSITISNDPRLYEEPWRQFCSEIDAEFVREKSLFNESYKVVGRAKDWTIYI